MTGMPASAAACELARQGRAVDRGDDQELGALGDHLVDLLRLGRDVVVRRTAGRRRSRRPPGPPSRRCRRRSTARTSGSASRRRSGRPRCRSRRWRVAGPCRCRVGVPAPPPPHAARVSARVRPAATAANFFVLMFSSSRYCCIVLMWAGLGLEWADPGYLTVADRPVRKRVGAHVDLHHVQPRSAQPLRARAAGAERPGDEAGRPPARRSGPGAPGRASSRPRRRRLRSAAAIMRRFTSASGRLRLVTPCVGVDAVAADEREVGVQPVQQDARPAG